MISSIKNYFSENTALLIRMDDIAENMNWRLMNKCEDLFDELNIKPLLGVIPKNEKLIKKIILIMGEVLNFLDFRYQIKKLKLKMVLKSLQAKKLKLDHFLLQITPTI